jgi:hypothetical protein
MLITISFDNNGRRRYAQRFRTQLKSNEPSTGAFVQGVKKHAEITW